MITAVWSPKCHITGPVPRRPKYGHDERQHLDIANTTGPLDPLCGKKALVISDVENLDYGARDLYGAIHHDRLAEKIRSVAPSCSLHAFFSRDPGDDAKLRYFENCGWTPHVRDIKTVRTHTGSRRLANSDPLILFYAGLLISRSSAEVVVLASGDGDLVTEIAGALKSLPQPRKLVTLSLAGSTSARLNSQINPSIEANLEIGRDCFESVGGRP